MVTRRKATGAGHKNLWLMAIGRATREALLSEAGFEKFSGPRIGSVGGSCFVDDFISCSFINGSVIYSFEQGWNEDVHLEVVFGRSGCWFEVRANSKKKSHHQNKLKSSALS